MSLLHTRINACELSPQRLGSRLVPWRLQPRSGEAILTLAACTCAAWDLEDLKKWMRIGQIWADGRPGSCPTCPEEIQGVWDWGFVPWIWKVILWWIYGPSPEPRDGPRLESLLEGPPYPDEISYCATIGVLGKVKFLDENVRHNCPCGAQNLRCVCCCDRMGEGKDDLWVAHLLPPRTSMF